MAGLEQLLEGLQNGDRKYLARAITLVENEISGYEDLLPKLLVNSKIPVTGITGPPGAGKSTLINALLKNLCVKKNAAGKPYQIAVLAIDPSSPFTHGSLLGDRLRMVEHFNNPNIYIRSLATRGALGGLSAKTLEVIDVLRSADFDHIIIETVGVGQSEVEIVSLADTTIVVLVPEAGDEIQALKSGIMEIADIFVVNKADREGADRFSTGLLKTLHERPANGAWIIPVLKTIASGNEGVDALVEEIFKHLQQVPPEKNIQLLSERAYRLIQQEKMRGIHVDQLATTLMREKNVAGFNLYAFVRSFAAKN
jgi:LAO/AO transport system kinase